MLLDLKKSIDQVLQKILSGFNDHHRAEHQMSMGYVLISTVDKHELSILKGSSNSFRRINCRNKDKIVESVVDSLYYTVQASSRPSISLSGYWPSIAVTVETIC